MAWLSFICKLIPETLNGVYVSDGSVVDINNHESLIWIIHNLYTVGNQLPSRTTIDKIRIFMAFWLTKPVQIIDRHSLWLFNWTLSISLANHRPANFTKSKCLMTQLDTTPPRCKYHSAVVSRWAFVALGGKNYSCFVFNNSNGNVKIFSHFVTQDTSMQLHNFTVRVQHYNRW